MARILLIESDHILADGIIRILAQDGHNVDWHVELQAATDSADKKAPQLIIIDLMLGGRSGVEFLYELRSYPEWHKLPVVVYSNIEPEEFAASNFGFAQLEIAAYHYKSATSLRQLKDSIRTVLQSVRV
ncbi:response regulator [Candidatus Saccharibacteria bacterium]|nr:response regulator [Candidatus Saccharibacteria bacterium]